MLCDVPNVSNNLMCGGQSGRDLRQSFIDDCDVRKEDESVVDDEVR